MAPPHHPIKSESATARYDKNHDIALLSDLGIGYRQIAKIKNTPISTVAGVVQRYRERGHVADTPRQGRPTKITEEVQQRVADTVEANPRASLKQITDTLTDLNIGHTTVDKVLKQLGFKLRIPRKSQFSMACKRFDVNSGVAESSTGRVSGGEDLFG